MVKNKIYWKNLICNYTVRLWYCWRYRKSKFRTYHCSKLWVTENQRKEIFKRFLDIDLTCYCVRPLNQQSNQKRSDSDPSDAD